VPGTNRSSLVTIASVYNLGLPENMGFAGLEPEPSAGTILPGETVTRPREIQFGLKLVF